MHRMMAGKSATKLRSKGPQMQVESVAFAQCDLCFEGKAVVECTETMCAANMCLECDRRVHMPGAMREHMRCAIDGRPSLMR